MDRDFIVVLDQGSSSSRALLMDASGTIYCRSQKNISAVYPAPGRAEYDAEKLFQSQKESLAEVLNAIPAGARNPVLGMTAQRSTVVLWDSTGGRPLCPAMSWQDGRAIDIINRLPFGHTQIHTMTGLYKTPYYSASKIAWAVENLTEVRAAAEKGTLRVGPVSTYILWRLSEGKIFACDPTFAQRTLLMNLRKGRWEEKLLSAFGIKKSWLPEIMPSSGFYGNINIEDRELSVTAMIGDQQAAMSGLGIDSPGEGAVNYGTGAFLLVNTGNRPLRIKGLIDSYGWKRSSEKKAVYFSEVLVNSAGTMLEWLRTRFGMFEDISEADGLCRVSRQRVLCLPVIGGLAAPYWDFEVKTCFSGLTASSCKADIVRAVTEGIAFMIADGLERIKQKGIKVNELKAGGGLSKMTYLMQFQADITGIRVAVTDEPESTALGAGREAVTGSGGTPYFQPVKAKTFLPRLNEEERQKLLLKWRDYVKHCQAGTRILKHALQ